MEYRKINEIFIQDFYVRCGVGRIHFIQPHATLQQDSLRVLHIFSTSDGRPICILNESFLKIGYLKKPFILVRLFFIKYDILTSSATTELYSKDVVLLNKILEQCPLDVASIMHSVVARCMGQAHEYIRTQELQNQF